MATSPTTYRRLPGQGSSAVVYYRLYEGPDHLLQVASTGFSETYKRFYYRDIQAFLVQKNGMRALWNWILGGILGLWGLGQLIGFLESPNWEPEWIIVTAVPATIFLGLLITNNALGSTCSCFVKTAVQTERLPSLKRLKQTQRNLERIKALVSAAQGSLPAQDFQNPVPVTDGPPVVEPPPPA